MTAARRLRGVCRPDQPGRGTRIVVATTCAAAAARGAGGGRLGATALGRRVRLALAPLVQARPRRSSWLEALPPAGARAGVGFGGEGIGAGAVGARATWSPTRPRMRAAGRTSWCPPRRADGDLVAGRLGLAFEPSLSANGRRVAFRGARRRHTPRRSSSRGLRRGSTRLVCARSASTGRPAWAARVTRDLRRRRAWRSPPTPRPDAGQCTARAASSSTTSPANDRADQQRRRGEPLSRPDQGSSSRGVPS